MSQGYATRVGLAQLRSTADVEANLAMVRGQVDEAAGAGATVVMLPEGFAYLGPAAGRLAIAEDLGGGPIMDACRALAREHRIHLVLGGFPERCDAERTYNTAVVLDPNGEQLAHYRKIHLFDVDLADGTRLQESASTAAGEAIVTCPMPFGTLGLTICYDLRFPRLFEGLVDQGANVICVPSAFTPRTGAAHWHVLLRARAIEWQSWILAPAQVGEHSGGRVSFGHSLAITPWGRIVADGGETVAPLVVDVDPELAVRARVELPNLEHRVL